MRNQNLKTFNAEVMRTIAKNFEKLKALCRYYSPGCYCAMSYEDFFQETVLVVAADEKAQGLSEPELMKFFVYRFKRTEFQFIQDDKMKKANPYQDGIARKEDIRSFDL